MLKNCDHWLKKKNVFDGFKYTKYEMYVYLLNTTI